MVLNEAAVEICKPQETLQLAPVGGFRPLYHCFHFGWVWLKVALFNGITEKRDSLDMEFTFFTLNKQSVLQEAL